MNTTPQDAAATTLAAPFPAVRRITKTIRFRADYEDLVQSYASASSKSLGRHVTQSEVIDQALTEFLTRQSA